MSSTKPSWPKRYAIVDCNSFYCSCERLFRPHLRNRPVAVLSNNDGCMISVSAEAKALGLRVGAPFFEARDIIKKHKIEVFSSNYQLYGDLSRRVMATLEAFTPDLEMYSIDEAFMDFSHVPPGEEEAYGQQIRSQVWRDVGIPVTVGIAPTKVLAKIANRAAKTLGLPSLGLMQEAQITAVLQDLPVRDVWGVGGNSAIKLRAHGITTARELRDHPNGPLVRALLTVTGERIRDELKGINCIVQTELAEKKMIASTRSFGKRVYDRRELAEAVATYVSFACEKLRGQKSVAQGLMVSLQTGRFDDTDTRYRNFVQTHLPMATNDTGVFTQRALELVQELYRPGIGFKKAGVFLYDISPNTEVQTDLFSAEDPKRGELMGVMDAINRRWGRSTVKMAACGTHQDWRMLCEHRSSKTQLKWTDLVEVKAEKPQKFLMK